MPSQIPYNQLPRETCFVKSNSHVFTKACDAVVFYFIYHDGEGNHGEQERTQQPKRGLAEPLSSAQQPPQQLHIQDAVLLYQDASLL